MRGTSGPTARNHPRIRRWVVGWSPRHPPVLDVDPRGLQTSRNPAPRGRISPVFWPLRCKVEGGWGGSAHYPDPTAQSVACCVELRAPATTTPGPGAGPVLGGLAEKKSKKNRFFFEGRCLFEVRGWGVEIACGDVAVGQPRGWPPPLLRSPTRRDGELPAAPTHVQRAPRR